MINLVKLPRFDMTTNDFWGPMESVMNSFFNDALETLPGVVRSSGSGRVYPKTDIYRDKDDLVFEAAVPFLNKDDLGVEITDKNILSIYGSCEKKESSESREYFRKELRRSKFTRRFVLPDSVVDNHTGQTAHFEDGVLVVVFKDAYKEPEVEESKSVVIDIE